MKKYESLIYSINEINKKLKANFDDIKIGYVLYRDWPFNKNEKKLSDDLKHIMGFLPSSEDINIKGNKDFEFEGGYDYEEDWANAYYKLSNFDLNIEEENIAIHICDSGDHDYGIEENKNYLLINALDKCSEKKIKIIGFILNDFSEKSFLECQKKYNGYYNLVNLADKNNLNEYDLYPDIKNNIENAIKNKSVEIKSSDISEIKCLSDNFEKDFEFPQENEIFKIIMKTLTEIELPYFSKLNKSFLSKLVLS
jgi:hypothetical protein